MIRYHCDFSGREITAEQSVHCLRFANEYEVSADYPEVPKDQVCSEIWHQDYNDSVAQYWNQKIPLLSQIENEKSSRLRNNRKEYFKPQQLAAK